MRLGRLRVHLGYWKYTHGYNAPSLLPEGFRPTTQV